MQEFRPTDVIDEDTRLAESLRDGDFAAIGTLVTRYGRAVGAVVATAHDVDHADRVVGVFAEAWLERDALVPGSDFAPWLGALAARAVDEEAADVERVWAAAMAVEAVDDAARSALRAHHADGLELPPESARHELRLRRRLAHLGDDAAVTALLAEPQQWLDPDADLTDRVRSRLGLGQVGSTGGAHGDAHAEGPEVEPGQSDPARPGRVARSLRPVLLGLAGAVVVLFVAIVALSAASGSADPVVLTAELTPTGAILDVEAGELTVTERDSGLRLDLEAPTLPRRAGDQFYQGVLVLQGGRELSVGTFNEGFGVVLSAGVSLDRVEEFLVVARDLGNDRSDVILKLNIPRI